MSIDMCGTFARGGNDLFDAEVVHEFSAIGLLDSFRQMSPQQ